MLNTRRTIVLCMAAMVVLVAGCSDEDNPVVPPPPVDDLWHCAQDTIAIAPGEYLNNRFFFPDLPERDDPGRDPSRYRIDVNSVQVYVHDETGSITEGFIENVAVYVDSTGVFDDSLGMIDFAQPYFHAERWRRLETDVLLDLDGELECIDLKQSLPPESTLAIVYRADDGYGNMIRVGDIPGPDEPGATLPDGEDYYRMKLLKAPETDKERYSFRYVRRNVYSLDSRNIDYTSFDLRIERNVAGFPDADLDESGIPYIRIFGLDRSDGHGGPPDGRVDLFDAYLFDLERGLLRFPGNFPHPFNSSGAQYAGYADDERFVWEGSYLSDHLIPQIYSPDIYWREYPDYRPFLIQVSCLRCVYDPPLLEAVPLQRTAWFWASAPLATDGDPRSFDPQDRVDAVRWFLPRERVVRRYLDPDLEGSARDETVTAMDLYLRADDDHWDGEDWGGIMQGLDMFGYDLSGAEYLDFWVNDAVVDDTQRDGRLHFDFGRISEDGFWPRDGVGNLEVGTWQQEDGIGPGTWPDGVWTYDEDIGLDGNEWGDQRYDPSYEIDGDSPFPGINGTARNARQDSEDLNGNTIMDRTNAYFSLSFNLRDSAEIDVLRDYDDVSDLAAANLAWRFYRIPLSEVEILSDGRSEPDLGEITHLRIWYEDATSARSEVHLQFAALRFVPAADAD